MNAYYYWYFSSYWVLLAATLLIGCLFLRKSYPLEYKLLVVLSAITFLVESGVMTFVLLNTPKPWLYNFFCPVESSFIVYILYRAASHPTIKRLYFILLAAIPISLGLLFHLTPDLMEVNRIVMLFYLFIDLLSACLFLIDVLLHKSDMPLTRHPFFWMSSGILIFCCVYVLIPPLLSYFKKMPILYFFVDVLVANLFMYSGFIACFTCFHRSNPSLRSAQQVETEIDQNYIR